MGICRCPLRRTDAACETLALPACRLADDPVALRRGSPRDWPWAVSCAAYLEVAFWTLTKHRSAAKCRFAFSVIRAWVCVVPAAASAAPATSRNLRWCEGEPRWRGRLALPASCVVCLSGECAVSLKLGLRNCRCCLRCGCLAVLPRLGCLAVLPRLARSCPDEQGDCRCLRPLGKCCSSRCDAPYRNWARGRERCRTPGGPCACSGARHYQRARLPSFRQQRKRTWLTWKVHWKAPRHSHRL